MRKYIFIVLIIPFFAVSCVEDDIWEPVPQEAEQTVFMYLPWATNLTSHFQQNIADFETALQDNILKNNRLVVFLSSSLTDAILFELKYENGKNTRTTLKEYINPAITTAEGITSILNDVKSFAPANRYAMIIGAHGMGWLPVEKEESRLLKSGREKSIGNMRTFPKPVILADWLPTVRRTLQTLLTV